MSVLIKNGTIVTASDKYVGDIFVDGEPLPFTKSMEGYGTVADRG